MVGMGMGMGASFRQVQSTSQKMTLQLSQVLAETLKLYLRSGLDILRQLYESLEQAQDVDDALRIIDNFRKEQKFSSFVEHTVISGGCPKTAWLKLTLDLIESQILSRKRQHAFYFKQRDPAAKRDDESGFSNSTFLEVTKRLADKVISDKLRKVANRMKRLKDFTLTDFLLSSLVTGFDKVMLKFYEGDGLELCVIISPEHEEIKKIERFLLYALDCLESEEFSSWKDFSSYVVENFN